MKQINRNDLTLADVKKLLLSGLYLRVVSAATGYTVPELSLMCKVWGIQRKRGPRTWKNTGGTL
jgi:hypothetical protein